MRAAELLAALVLGGVSYGLIELYWRGRTHWTMVLTGGVCFALMYLAAAAGLSFPVRWVLAVADVTAVEFLVGAAVNVGLGWRVWDYSAEPMNLYGQVCLRYSVLWALLGLPACALAGLLRWMLSGQ